MSYGNKDALIDLDDAIYQALNTRNTTHLRSLANILKGQGADEEAERLLEISNRWIDEDWSYDEERDNRVV